MIKPQIKKPNSLRLPGNLTTPFMGKTRVEPKHPGIDVANRAGTPVPAMADGVITRAEFKKDGFGNVAILKDAGGNVHQYAHLLNAVVKPGQKIKKGQVVGRMGSSGGTSYSPTGGDPTHVDIRVASKDGKWVNPLSLLKN